MKATFHRMLLMATWLVCLVSGSVFIFWAPVWTLPLQDGAPLWVWRIGWLREFRWELISVLIFLPVVFWLLSRKNAQTVSRAGRTIAPLAAMPLAGAVAMAGDLLPLGVASNVRFFLPLALLSWCLAREWPALSRIILSDTRKRLLGFMLVPVAAIYAWACYDAHDRVGPSDGDECCYIIMSESIIVDHTLDTKLAWARNGRRAPSELKRREHMHLAPNARDERWYSYHPFGLPLLMAPLWPMGTDGRVGHAMGMGLIAALGCAGLWLICRRVGASLAATLLAMSMVCMSVLWVGFASRVLTELPGAVLLIWSFWAIAARKDYPWRTLFVAAFASVYCAFTHMRLLPLGLLAGGLYGLDALLYKEPWRPKFLRLGVYSLLLVIGYGAWILSQAILYTGMAQPAGDVLWSFPNGTWAILVDRFGAAAGLPGLYVLMAAQVVWWFRGKEHAMLKVGIFACFVACAAVNCSNQWPFVSYWDCLPGRYLLAAIPLLVPGAAVALTYATPLAAGFCAFIALSGFAITGFYFLFLESFGVMGHPLLHMTADMPSLVGFFMPWATYFESSPATARYATIAFALIATAAGYLVLRLRHGGSLAVPVISVAVAIVAGVVAHEAQNYDRVFSPTALANLLGRVDREQIDWQRPQGHESGSLANLMEKRIYRSKTAKSITVTSGQATTSVSPGGGSNTVSNDWLGRPLKWTTVMPGFRSRRGDQLLEITGSVSGRVDSIELAVLQGGKTRWEGPLKTSGNLWKTVVTAERKGGDFSIFARVDGDGAWQITSIQWLPWSSGWRQ